MFKDKELIDDVAYLRKQLNEVDSKYHKLFEALKEYFKVEVRTEDIIMTELSFLPWVEGKKYVGEKYNIVPVKKEKKVSKKKNNKSKK